MSDDIQQKLEPTALSHHRTGDKDPHLVGALPGWLQHGGEGSSQAPSKVPTLLVQWV